MNKKFTTPDLPYGYDALEPYIDEATMKIHHDKHHVAYTTKLNAAVEKHPELFAKDPVDLLKDLNSVPEDIRLAVRNNGGGHVNHMLYWEVMGPDAGGEPEGKLLEAIKNGFGGFEKFQELFEDAATTQFGSGWAWLSVEMGKLVIEKTSNQDTPLSAGRLPILALDVWEHAYYLKYQNKRPEYIKAFWNVINWESVGDKYDSFI
ncbi:MAG: superoxide dismutase [Patescibacteria group bacterium]|jgi:Fe-Mn family superoxide dismutase